MTEQDLKLKTQVRRLFWRMGLSTKVDVALRAYVPERAGRNVSGFEEYTDLDVLGLAVEPDLRVQAIIADCRTSPRGSTERMFWIRGVADFFGAHDAYMVRSNEATAASRQLADRLGVAVLAPADLAILEDHHPTTLDLARPEFSFLFEENAVHRYRKSFRSLDKKLRPLLEYVEFDFWVYEPHRNLLQVVAHLVETSASLDPNHPTHVALLAECAWIYARSLTLAVKYVRRTHITDVDTALREYLFGGQLGLREKRTLAQVARQFAGRAEAVEDLIFPAYFPKILELVSRMARRPTHLINVLRYAEWLAEASVARRLGPISTVFGSTADNLAAKLLMDICGFLVGTARLNPTFQEHLSRVLLSRNEQSQGQNDEDSAHVESSAPQTELLEASVAPPPTATED